MLQAFKTTLKKYALYLVKYQNKLFIRIVTMSYAPVVILILTQQKKFGADCDPLNHPLVHFSIHVPFLNQIYQTLKEKNKLTSSAKLL